MPDHDNTPAGTRIGQAVKTRREELGWTQQDLGRAADASYSTVQLIERGQINLKSKKLQQIAEVLGWAPRSIETIAAGGEPALAPSNDPKTDAGPPSPGITLAAPHVALLTEAMTRLHALHDPGAATSWSDCLASTLCQHAAELLGHTR